MTYRATIKHSTISHARVVEVSDNLTQAKLQASAEFSDEHRDYTIVIFDDRDETVASRRVADNRWTNA